MGSGNMAGGTGGTYETGRMDLGAKLLVVDSWIRCFDKTGSVSEKALLGSVS